jgi:CheY-like chemotaxis protein
MAIAQAESVDVLYVEDNAELREPMCEILREEGFLVHGSENGSAALAFLEKGHRPLLIILDLQMPVMSGYEFLGWLRSTRALSETPVLILSAVAKPGILAGPNGVVTFLSKPFDVDELLGYVRRLARRKLHLAVVPGEN